MKSLRLMHPVSKGLAQFSYQRWGPLWRKHSSRRCLAAPVTVTLMARSGHGATSTDAPLASSSITSDLRLDDSVDGFSAGPPQDLEEWIEKVIYGCRFMAFVGVAGSLMGSALCFLKGCVYVMNSFVECFVSGGKVIFMLIEAIDVYLIGTVMLVFGMGLYELFISNLDIAKTSSHGSNLLGLFKIMERPKWLEIKSVNELKTKLGHVIVMVLLVGLFEKSKKVVICSPRDLLCFAASILLSSGCLYLLSKLHTAGQRRHD